MEFLFFRFVFLVLQEEENCGRNRKGSEACHLRTLEKPKGKVHVIPAQVFQKEASRGVKHDIQGEALSLGMLGGAEDEEKGEDDEVKLSLPYFRWPKRLVAIGVVGKRGGRIENPKA